jgi:hypothetical protein
MNDLNTGGEATWLANGGWIIGSGDFANTWFTTVSFMSWINNPQGSHRLSEKINAGSSDPEYENSAWRGSLSYSN